MVRFSLSSEGDSIYLLKGGILCRPWGFEVGDLILGRTIYSKEQVGSNIYKLSEIDCSGMIVSPGLVDVHVHGSMGYDIMDGSMDSMERMARSMIPTGVTSFVGATMSQPLNRLDQVLSVAESYRREQNHIQGVARFLGVHLEGPFISSKKAGAHDLRYLIAPDRDFILSHSDVISIVTLAPELDGASDLIRLLESLGIVCSIGHSDCDYMSALKAVSVGASGFTHLYNAMSQMGHRSPGMVGAAFDSGAYCEMIFDGVHVHPSALRTACKAVGPGRVLLITDSMRARGLGEGSFDLGGKIVNVSSDRAELVDGTLAGSVLSLLEAIKNAVSWGALTLHQALNGATLNPARYIGDRSIGSLDRGCRGDVILLDRETVALKGVFVDGELRYHRDI